ncbi:unnamed protein product [Ectocarpus sp. 12 AP-2014]
MAKNAAKKRRSGTRKVSKKLKNTFRYKKPDISSAVVRERWDSNLTAETNMAKMGLRQSANRDIRAPARRAAASAAPGGKIVESCEVSRLFGKKKAVLYVLLCHPPIIHPRQCPPTIPVVHATSGMLRE